MATWHQQQRPVPFWHETKWTLLSDPPNDMAFVTRFDTAKQADECKARWEAAGQKYLSVLPPANHYRHALLEEPG